MQGLLVLIVVVTTKALDLVYMPTDKAIETLAPDDDVQEYSDDDEYEAYEDYEDYEDKDHLQYEEYDRDGRDL